MRGAIDRDGGYGSSIVTAALILGGGAFVVDRLMAGAYLELVATAGLLVAVVVMVAVAATVFYTEGSA